MGRNDNTGDTFKGHVFIDGALWPSWGAWVRYVRVHGTYAEASRQEEGQQEEGQQEENPPE